MLLSKTVLSFLIGSIFILMAIGQVQSQNGNTTTDGSTTKRPCDGVADRDTIIRLIKDLICHILGLFEELKGLLDILLGCKDEEGHCCNGGIIGVIKILLKWLEEILCKILDGILEIDGNYELHQIYGLLYGEDCKCWLWN